MKMSSLDKNQNNIATYLPLNRYITYDNDTYVINLHFILIC